MASYKQLRAVNTNVTDEAGFCLRFSRRVVGIAAKYGTAQVAFDKTKKRHGAGEALPNVAVPVWFDWSKDDDVAFWIPGRGVLGTPLRGKGQRWDASPQARAKAIGGTYKGWTEDLNDVDVVQKIATPVPAPSTGMPPIGGTVKNSVDRTFYKRNSAVSLGVVKAPSAYKVLGYDQKFPGSVWVHSASKGDARLALYYVNGARIEGTTW